MKQDEMIAMLKRVIKENQNYTTWTVSTPHLMQLVNNAIELEREEGEERMNPTDKYEQIKDIKRLNPVQQEAMVLKHEQEIKDIAKHLLALNKKEKKEWVGLTDEEKQAAYIIVDGWSNCVNFIEKTLREKNNG